MSNRKLSNGSETRAVDRAGRPYVGHFLHLLGQTLWKREYIIRLHEVKDGEHQSENGRIINEMEAIIKEAITSSHVVDGEEPFQKP